MQGTQAPLYTCEVYMQEYSKQLSQSTNDTESWNLYTWPSRDWNKVLHVDENVSIMASSYMLYIYMYIAWLWSNWEHKLTLQKNHTAIACDERYVTERQ
jgi:hypothetical protein